MKWEFLTAACPADELYAELKRLGDHGWQLAGMAPGGVMKSPLATQATPGFILVFQRPVRLAVNEAFGEPASRLTGALTNGDGGG